MGKFNGFGRLNLVARLMLQRDHVELVPINDLFITTDYMVHYQLPNGVSRLWKEKDHGRHYNTSSQASVCWPITAKSTDDLQMLRRACQKITRARNNIAEMSGDHSIQTSGNHSGHRVVHHHIVLRLGRVMGTSSHGTTVFHGACCSRRVAVKRLIRGHCEVARGIHANLLDCRHPNVVLYEPVIESKDFVYICQDLCDSNLTDLVRAVSANVDLAAFSNVKYREKLEYLRQLMKNFELWTALGHPSPLLLKLMREMTLAVAHLHDSNIIHGDIKPNNVLITKSDTLSAKLTDIGIIKCLQGVNSIWGNRDYEWQGSEMHCPGAPPTREGDIFSLGHVFSFCVRNHGSDCETQDLISSLLNSNPDSRPKASEVLKHPALWTPEMRLSFLRDVSDWLELEPYDAPVLRAIERRRRLIFGGRSWHKKVHPAIMKNLILHRAYHVKTLKDLVRAIRNRYSHHTATPQLLRAIEGLVPEGFESYYSKQFPKLLMHLYKAISLNCGSEVVFRKYFF